MASASSLLGLVSQLQSLESSFAAILMEAAMKLANLTDANIFFLVETPQGRKFSGKRHLCDLYVGGELAPVGDDVEFEIDPSITAIHERVVMGGGGVEGLLEAEAFDANDVLFDSDFSTTASSSFVDDSYHGDPHQGGQLRKILPAPFSQQHRRNVASAASSRKSKRPVFASQNGPSSPTKRFKSINCKMEPIFDDQLKDADSTSLEANRDSSGGGGGGNASSANASEAACAEGNRYGANGGGAGFSSNGAGVSLSSSQLNGDVFEAGGEYDMASIAHARLPETKLSAFAGIQDPSVYVKGSVENRLAVSVCYDFGKALAELRPPHFTEEEAKAFLKANFDRWILQYGNLRSFLDVMIPNGNPEKGVQFSFMGMLRKAARSGYGCSKKNWNRSRTSLAVGYVTGFDVTQGKEREEL